MYRIMIKVNVSAFSKFFIRGQEVDARQLHTIIVDAEGEIVDYILLEDGCTIDDAEEPIDTEPYAPIPERDIRCDINLEPPQF